MSILDVSLKVWSLFINYPRRDNIGSLIAWYVKNQKEITFKLKLIIIYSILLKTFKDKLLRNMMKIILNFLNFGVRKSNNNL